MGHTGSSRRAKQAQIGKQHQSWAEANPIKPCDGHDPETNAACDLLMGHDGRCAGDPDVYRLWSRWHS